MNPRLEKKLAELKTKFAREEVFRELAQANLVRDANFIEDLTPADYLWEMVSDASTPADFTLSHDAPRNAIDAWLNKVQTHFRALENLYRSAPINRLFRSELTISEPGRSVIEFDVDEEQFHAAGAVHGTVYFKMMDDAAFYAANSLVSDRFLLTTAFNLLFTRPIGPGRIRAEGRWVSGKRRVFVAEASLVDMDGEEVGRGTGTFMRSHIPLSSLPGYAG